MNLLMLGVGAAGLDNPHSEPVRRHLEYARRLGGHIDLIVDGPRPMRIDHGPGLRVWATGTGRMGYIPRASRLALQAALDRPPDLITTQDPFLTAFVGIHLRSRLSRPLIIQNHSSFFSDDGWVEERPFVFGTLRVLAREALTKADGWRVVNTRERKYYVEKLRLPPSLVRVLPVPCDIAPFLENTPDETRRERRNALGIGRDAPTCLWVGRPVRVKCLPLLFDAHARIRAAFPEARLALIGDRQLAQEDLDQAAEKAGVTDSLVWVGAVAHADLPSLYAMADVFLFPSRYEGLPRVLVEAGASALPAVATATAGARDIILHGETGFLSPIGDGQDLASHVRALLATPAQAQALGHAARQHVRVAFDPGRAYDAIVDHWREVASRRP